MKTENISRRQILGASIAAGALVWGSKAHAQTSATPAAPATAPKMAPPKISANDLALLGAALKVEQLQAALFAQVLGAQERRAYLPERALELVRGMAQIQNAHVAAISGVLTGAGAEAPTANFQFAANTFFSPIAVSWTGYTLAEIAIGSHLYALEKLESRSLRATVVGIIGANSRHAALLRNLSGFSFAPRYFESKFSPAQINALLARYQA